MKELENILVCPETQAPLRAVRPEALGALMERIKTHALISEPPIQLKRPLTGAFQVVGQEKYYPVIDGIIGLLPEMQFVPPESLPLRHSQQDHTKKAVQQFYDEIGWQASDGVFKDAKDSEDLRPVSAEYIENCHLRLKRFLPKSGRYLLDVASGPIQYEAYLSYSENFQYRICADISIRALQSAKKKLGKKGIYLLCDVTQLPLKTGQIDALVSLHTLYHVPQSFQATAFSELNRVLKPEGVSLIVYSWGGHSLLMALALLPFKCWKRFKQAVLKPTNDSGHALYFHATPYRRLQRQVLSQYNTTVRSWRSVNVPFLQYYVHQFLGGKYLLRWIYRLEERFPRFMGRFGAYPLLISHK